MSQDDPVRHIVRNNQNQPVELHLPSGVLVLLPRETAELSEDDLAAPQLRALQRGRRITLQRSTEPPPVTGPPSTPEASSGHGDTAQTSSGATARTRRRGTTRGRG